MNRRHPKLGKLNTLVRTKKGLEDRVKGEKAIHLSSTEVHAIKEKHAKACAEIQRLYRQCVEMGLIPKDHLVDDECQ